MSLRELPWQAESNLPCIGLSLLPYVQINKEISIFSLFLACNRSS